MSVKNMSDEELDRLFKEAADNFDPPFDPEAWAAMDQKLDLAENTRSKYKRYLPLLLLLTMLSLLTVYKFGPESEGERPLAQAQKPANTAATPSPKMAPTHENNSGKRRQEETSLVNREPATVQTQVAPLTHLPQVVKGEKQMAAPTQGRSTGNRGVKPRVLLATVTKRKPTLIPERRVQGQKVPLSNTTPKSEEGNIGSEGKAETIGAAQRPANDPAQEIHADTAGKTTESEATPDLVKRNAAAPVDSLFPAVATVLTDSSVQNEKREGEKPTKKNPYFLKAVQLAVAVAPDFTTVKFKDQDAVSANVGLLVAVPVSKRFSLVTGAVWANKVYTARPEDYTFPAAGYKADGSSLIDATCRVLDIPVNVRYQFWAKGKNGLAVQAGLSSYLMLSEQYKYQYTVTYYGNATTYSKVLEVENENKHWFGVQNLSVVYTRTLSPSFALGVEPFAKIPLAGVGAGKVKLTSAGVFFSLGYTVGGKP
ncbi:MAG: hypothetical protein ACO1OQ_08420 [Rufibacter sp.]